jgi:hypothetical protein
MLGRFETEHPTNGNQWEVIETFPDGISMLLLQGACSGSYPQPCDQATSNTLGVTISTWTAAALYVGESKIIRNIGTCFAVGYTAGWACQYTHGLLLSYHCGASVTLIVHFCREFCAINTDAPHLICTKKNRGQWAEGVPGVEMHRRMSVQYGNSVMSQQIVCEWIERLKNGCTSVEHGKGTGRQPTSITGADAE